MTTAHYLVTVHLNIDLPLALLQPEPADNVRSKAIIRTSFFS